jgi:hypothetical protein
MALDLLKKTRFFALATTVALGGACAVGCTANVDASDVEAENEASTDAITDVDQTEVKRQSIGNCWMYATMSWMESLHLSATGNHLNASESYGTFWHWFEQIANGSTTSTEISTGGHWSTAVDLFTRYGVMTEKDFIPEEATSEMSGRQSSALAAINDSLKNGALKSRTARRDRTLVKRELEKAWRLSPEMVARLDKVFGASVSRTLDRSSVSLTGTNIKRTSDIAVKLSDPRLGRKVDATLKDVIGTRSSWGTRTGNLAWREVSYGYDARSRREVLKRIQRALHDGQPVVMSWFVDFNSLDGQGRFAAPPATPGRQGGHLVVMEDYQINDVPGFGTLQAGVRETRPEALAAALDNGAKIEFIRIKNSWGGFRPDRAFVLPGYHDLYMKYLDGPVKQCSEKNGTADPTNCWDTTPFRQVVLPAGY